MIERRKSVQFHTTINKSLLNNFKQLCKHYNISTSAGVKALIKNSVKNAQLPGMQKQINRSLFFKKYSALPKTSQKFSFMVKHLKDLDKVVIPKNVSTFDVYNKVSRLYFNIWVINAYILTKIFGKKYKVLPGAPYDDMLARLLTEVWILSGDNSAEFKYQCKLLLKSHDKKLWDKLVFYRKILNRLVPKKTINIVIKPNVRGLIYLIIAHRNIGLRSVCRYSYEDYIIRYRRAIYSAGKQGNQANDYY